MTNKIVEIVHSNHLFSALVFPRVIKISVFGAQFVKKSVLDIEHLHCI